MNNDEAEEVFVALLALLQVAGLGWIGEQANEEISEGRIVGRVPARREPRQEVTVSLASSADLFEDVDIERAYAIGKRAAISSSPLTAIERVGVLIRALHRAVTDSDAVEGELARFFAAEVSQENLQPGIALYSALESATGRTNFADIGSASVEERRRLALLLDMLERRVAT